MLNYQRVTLLRGKSTISMCHFLIAMLNYQRVTVTPTSKKKCFNLEGFEGGSGKESYSTVPP
jgi:hypothetical protein